MEEAHNDFNIKTRIIRYLLSLNYARANKKVIDFLKEDPSIKMFLGGSLMHIRCCAHILNLCIQEGLGELRPLLEPIRGVIKWIRVASYLLNTPTRWNSTYKLLHDAIVYRDVLSDIYSEFWADGRFITNEYWSLAMIIHDVLETFDNATHIFFLIFMSRTYTW
ncbi:putative AC transposase [Bienertia sinuspersici]